METQQYGAFGFHGFAASCPCWAAFVCVGASPALAQVINVVVAESICSSVVEAVGGTHVRVVSLLDNPNINPHAF